MENYEQKYKEALKIMESLHSVVKYQSSSDALLASQTIEKAFPELKESKDDRIRKAIFKALSKKDARDVLIENGIQVSDALTWLEKQGEGSIIDLKEYAKGILKGAATHLMIWIDENLADGNMCLSNMECEDLEDAMVNAKWDKIYNYIKKKVEKQGEQKYIDESKPKFNVGDWITNGEYIWKVTDIKPLDYILQSQNGEVVDDTISYVDEEFHIWTIEDAKDGDILMANAPFIFNGNLEGGIGCPGAYCGINTLGKFQIPEHSEHWTGHTTTPATKEQSDLLFQKMKEAGYEWDAEKKELKKVEQKPAWSEEEEEMIDFMIEFIESLYWRKDLTKRKDEVLSWLKSIKDRVQSKQEWSEGDRTLQDSSISYLCNLRDTFEAKGWDKEQIQKCINWLKSLIPQSHWKPSEQNIKDLEWCADLVKDKMGVGFHRLQVFIDELKSL